MSYILEWDERLPLFIFSDPARICQVLFNLISNVFKFTESGSIRVVAKKYGGHVCFSVIDTGIGITAEFLPSVFERFSPAICATVESFSGTGLGLSISRELIRLMKGSIDVESKEGAGARFSIPLIASEKEHREKETIVNLRKLPSLRLLLAEDNGDYQFLFQRYLSGFGWTTDIFPNGEIAVQKVMTNQHDIILLEIQMPVMDGITAFGKIQELMQSGVHPQVPVLALTAFALENDRKKFFDIGFKCFIPKPVKKMIFRISLQNA